MCRMAVLTLAFVLVGSVALAVEPEDAVPTELLLGTAGGYAGALVGASTLSWAFSAGATGWDALARAIFGAFVGFTGGTIVGSSLGVLAAGGLFGIEGNIGLCFLGAAGGMGAALGIGLALDISETIFPFAPPIAAAAATAGFNVGARPRGQK